MNHEFDSVSLPSAVQWLFEANGYHVYGPIHKNGAELDLVAESLSGFGSQKIYMEVTTQLVDTTKYGKDLTKLVLFRSEAGARRVIVSSKGFTLSVRERAAAEGIDTYTYDELFRSFERLTPYVNLVLNTGNIADDLDRLQSVYVEPSFDDAHGNESATEFLTNWYQGGNTSQRWIVVVGEYGTGKTALTRILQRRWTALYARQSTAPIPFRIELRHFSKQFDSRGLLHHFLDRNGLGSLGIEFVEAMVAQGRIVLLLDGYDEMAQYLNLRERRACLEALADLAVGGARGILTSRPNYFTEAEELRVFDALYRGISGRIELSSIDRSLLAEEERLDVLLDDFVVRRTERQLRDLTPEQTEELVLRHLQADVVGRDAVLRVLRNVTRGLDTGDAVSLSGKPVIISYLLEVVEELKRDLTPNSPGISSGLSEWQVFELIVDKLMLRDFRRNSELLPAERHQFLNRFSVYVTRLEHKVVDEDTFRSLLADWYSTKIARKSAEGVAEPLEMLFNDLRASSTLTRSDVRGKTGWQFSHNSLREFLLVESMVTAFLRGSPLADGLPITEAMHMFVRAMKLELLNKVVDRLAAEWVTRRESHRMVDQMFVLMWPALFRVSADGTVRSQLQRIVGPGMDVSGAHLYRISVGGDGKRGQDLQGLAAEESELSEVDFTGLDLRGSHFRNAFLESVTFRDCDLRGSSFENAVVWDCDFTGAAVDDCDFRGLDEDSSGVVDVRGQSQQLAGSALIGFLQHKGGLTDNVPAYYLYSHHKDFDVCEKICRYLMAEGWRQRLGLEQKGEASRNVPLAREFVKELIQIGYVEARGGSRSNSLLRATPTGRTAFMRLVDLAEVDDEFSAVLARHLP